MLAQLALVIFAMQRALKQGLTRDRVPADLVQVDWVDMHSTAPPVWTAQQPTLADHTPEIVLSEARSDWARGTNDAQITLLGKRPV